MYWFWPWFTNVCHVFLEQKNLINFDVHFVVIFFELIMTRASGSVFGLVVLAMVYKCMPGFLRTKKPH
jgi:hypothetical protein